MSLIQKLSKAIADIEALQARVTALEGERDTWPGAVPLEAEEPLLTTIGTDYPIASDIMQPPRRKRGRPPKS